MQGGPDGCDEQHHVEGVYDGPDEATGDVDSEVGAA